MLHVGDVVEVLDTCEYVGKEELQRIGQLVIICADILDINNPNKLAKDAKHRGYILTAPDRILDFKPCIKESDLKKVGHINYHNVLNRTYVVKNLKRILVNPTNIVEAYIYPRVSYLLQKNWYKFKNEESKIKIVGAENTVDFLVDHMKVIEVK